MVTAILLDTDILIEQLRQMETACTFQKLFNQKHRLCISAITITELWTGESILQAERKRDVTALLKITTMFSLSKPILQTAGVLLRMHNHLYLGDALIAATAIHKHLPLATLNAKHFSPIADVILFPDASRSFSAKRNQEDS